MPPVDLTRRASAPTVERDERKRGPCRKSRPTVELYYRHARVLVAPLRYGAGLKSKILEAMAFGVPVVAAPVGVESIGLTHGATAMIGDDAPVFAAAVLALYQDRDLWLAVRTNARQSIDEQYLVKQFGRRLDNLLNGGRP